MRRIIVTAAIFLLALALPCAAQVMSLQGTTSETFTLGTGANKITLTNSSGALALSGGLTISAGTVNLTGSTVITTSDINGGTIDSVAIGESTASTGAFTTISASGQITSTVGTGTAPLAIASTTKVANLNVDQVDGMSLSAGSNGGVAYQSSSSQLSFSTAGTTGQLLLSGGSVAPTWTGLTSAYLFVGNGSNIPTAVALSGDATIDNAGVLTVASGAITAAKLADTVADAVLTATLSAGSEVSDTITCTLQVKDVQGNNLAAVHMVHWGIADSDYGAGETGQAVTVSYTNGAEWQQITQHKKAVAFTDATGKLVLDVTHTGANTLYLMCSVSGKVYSVTLAFS